MSGREGHIPFVKRPAILALKWYTNQTWEEISTNLDVHPRSAQDIVEKAKEHAQDPTNFTSVLECVGFGTLIDGCYCIKNAQEYSHYLTVLGQNVIAMDGSRSQWEIRFNRGRGDYSIIHTNTGLRLGQETGSRKISIGTNRNSAGQRWVITSLKSGYFRVTNVRNADRAMAIQDSIFGHSIAVVCVEQADDERQQWEFENSG